MVFTAPPSGDTARAGRPGIPALILLLAGLTSVAVVLRSQTPPAPLPPPSHIVDDVTISIYSPGGRDASAVAGSFEIPLDWVMEAMYPCAGCSRATLDAHVQMIHARGQLYVLYVSAGLVYKGGNLLGDLRPDLLDAAAVDLDGRKMTSSWGSLTTYKMNVNEPVWREFLRSEIAAGIEAGADGIVFDDIQAQVLTVGFNPAGVFNEPDMEGFRAFLRTVYAPDVLASRFGITTLDTFNYRTYILERGHADRWRSTPWEVPLFNEFRVFEYQSTLQHYAEMVRWAKDHAETTTGKSIVFLGNTSTGLDMSLPFERSLDVAWPEFPYKQFGWPPRCKAIPSAKVTTNGRLKKGVYLTQVPTNTELVERGHPPNIAKIFLAEAYAARAEYQVPYEVVGASGNYSPDLRELAPYYQFVAANRSWFGKDWTWRPRVAIFYPVSSYIGGPDSYYGAALALLESGVQFDAVFSGDGRMMLNTATPATLAPYPVVVLSNAVGMTAEQVQLILDYVRGGGTVVGWGSPGAANEFQDWSVQREADWRNFWSVGSRQVGNGTMTLVSQSDLAREYFTNRTAAARDDMLRAVAPMAPAEVATNVEHVVGLIYRHAVDDRLAIHLVNYDYNLENDSVREVGPVTVRVRLPAGFDLAGKRVRFLSPDIGEPQAIEYQVADGRATFTVPRLYIYGIIAVDGR